MSDFQGPLDAHLDWLYDVLVTHFLSNSPKLTDGDVRYLDGFERCQEEVKGWLRDRSAVSEKTVVGYYWSRRLEEMLDERLDDGTPVLEVVFAMNPDLKSRLKKVING